MPLTDAKCRSAKTDGKLVKLSDMNGLQLHITPAGSKIWRGAYRFDGKQKAHTLGEYPHVTLEQARSLWRDAKQLVNEGIDPAIDKRVRKAENVEAHRKTFADTAREWRKKKYEATSKSGDDALHRVEMNMFPALGDMPVSVITPRLILTEIARIEARGSLDMANRVQAYTRRIFDFAMAMGYCKANPAAPVKEAMSVHKAGHFAAISVEDLPQLLKDITRGANRMELKTQIGMKLLMHTFVRTQELVCSPWGELDFEKKLWIVPTGRMKMKREHVVPMSRQVVEMFKEMEAMTKGRPFIFPHRSDSRGHMSKMTILQALKRLGYAGKMTGHGFRSLAYSTLTQELGYNDKIVDLQLAHVKKSKVRQAYDRAKWLDVRTQMMQDWSDYIDKVTASVI